MKVTKQETLYHEDYGATLKHKCGKRDSSIAVFLGLFWPFFFYLGNALIMMIIILLLITTQGLQLETRTRYDSI